MRKTQKVKFTVVPKIKGLGHRNKIKLQRNNLSRIEVNRVENAFLIEEEAPIIYSMRQIRTIAQKAMKDKGLTEADVRKTLGVKRYEK